MLACCKCEPSGTNARQSGDWVISLSYMGHKCARVQKRVKTCVNCMNYESPKTHRQHLHLPCTPCWKQKGKLGL